MGYKFPQKRSIWIKNENLESGGYELQFYNATEVDRWRKENHV